MSERLDKVEVGFQRYYKHIIFTMITLAIAGGVPFMFTMNSKLDRINDILNDVDFNKKTNQRQDIDIERLKSRTDDSKEQLLGLKNDNKEQLNEMKNSIARINEKLDRLILLQLDKR